MHVSIALLLSACSCGGDGDADGGMLSDAGASDSGVFEDSGTVSDGSVADSGPDGSTSVDAGEPDAGLPEPIGPLPAHSIATDGRFTTHDACASCHLAVEGDDAMRDASGRDVSPISLYRTSMMAQSARDPYWLASFSHELAAHEESTALIEFTCTRCHLTSANVERGRSNSLHFDEVASGESAQLAVGRDGATCTVCHQIQDQDLGTDQSYTGGFVIGDARELYGPHSDPVGQPMFMATGYTPVTSAHIRDSALCATCHTVITEAIDAAGNPSGPEFPEQVPYLEWRNSIFSTEVAVPDARAASCQDCHMPRTDEDGVVIVSRLSTRPRFLDARDQGRHTLVGGNAYMLELLSLNVDWARPVASASALLASSQATEANLRTAAEVEITSLTNADGQLSVQVQVRNEAGHRFPTGYPTRRAFLRLSVLDAAGAVLWRSGRLDEFGGLVSDDGARLDQPGTLIPHQTLITQEDQVQVYETQMHDASGRSTHVLLDATGFLKDNRLLPLGYSATHAEAPMTSPVGAEGDADFVGGRDDISYQIPTPATAASVEVELLYQTLSRPAVEGLLDHGTSSVSRLWVMHRDHPDLGRLVSSDSRGL